MSKGRRIIYTPERVQFLRENYPRHNIKELTELFNRRFGASKTEIQIKSMVSRHGITSGRTGHFPKGNKPWNTGTKGLTGANITSFKKGNSPPNRKPLWSERIDSKDGHILIKVPERDPYTGFPTRYKLKHLWVWEQEHGPLPKGGVVGFKDGNILNCDPGNLMLLTRVELLALNLHGYKDQPSEIKPSILALAKMEVKARIRTKPGRGRRKIDGHLMRQLSSAPEGQSVSNSWFSPQRSGGEVQEFAAQLPHSPRAERGGNAKVSGRRFCLSAGVNCYLFMGEIWIREKQNGNQQTNKSPKPAIHAPVIALSVRNITMKTRVVIAPRLRR